VVDRIVIAPRSNLLLWFFVINSDLAGHEDWRELRSMDQQAWRLIKQLLALAAHLNLKCYGAQQQSARQI
jgi:hypothetical protein